MCKLYFLFSLLLVGCSTTTWDGRLSGYDRYIVFLNEGGAPVSGVTSKCHGNNIWPSDEISEELNLSTPISNEHGVMKLSHGGYGIGGSSRSFFGVEFETGEQWNVICNFRYQDKKVASDSLLQFNQPVVIVVETKI